MMSNSFRELTAWTTNQALVNTSECEIPNVVMMSYAEPPANHRRAHARWISGTIHLLWTWCWTNEVSSPSGQMPRWYPLITSTRGSQRNCNSSDMPSWSRDHQAGRKFPKQTVAVEFGKSTFVASLTSSLFEFEGAVHGELQQQLYWQRYEKRTVGRRWARMNSWEWICVCVQWCVSKVWYLCYMDYEFQPS